jgi:outer membrane murein-binding lipoprotein Lpp
MIRRMGFVLITALLTFLLLQGRTAAQSASNLQADIFELRSQVNQLRSQVGQLSRQMPSDGRAVPSRPSPSRATPRSPTDPSDPQIIDRLAVLAIEAKDRLTALENRVSKLEQRAATGGQR